MIIPKHPARSSLLALAASTALFATAASGQAQVSNQVDPQRSQGGVRQIDPRVNPELYGNNYSGGAVRYPHQVLLLPSEERFAIERSGALPSEIRANADAVGPLAPYGNASYIPYRSPLQAAVNARPPALFGPAYATQPTLPQTGATPTPVPSPDLPQPAAHPAEPQSPADAPPPPQYIQPRRVTVVGQPIDRRVASSFGPLEGGETTHYYRLPTRPTTQPATQPAPSLADEPANK